MAALQAVQGDPPDEPAGGGGGSPARQLLTQLRRLELLVERLPEVLYVDRPGVPGREPRSSLWVSPQVESVLGVSRAEWTAGEDSRRRVMHVDDWPTASWQYEEWLKRGGVLVQEYRIVRPDTGEVVEVRDECLMLADPVTGETAVFGVISDVSAPHRLEEQLRAAEARHRALLDQIPGVVWTEPLPGNPDPPFVSAAVTEVFGATQEEWLREHWWEQHLHPDDRDRVLDAQHAAAARGESLRTEYRMTTASGREIVVSDVSRVVHYEGRPYAVQSVLEDVTELRHLDEAAALSTSHDPLTGLPGRPLLDQSLDQALARARRQGTEVVLLAVDLDHFQQVNETHGRRAGDDVLRIIASRLSQSARASDLVARRGADDYLVLLTDIEPDGGREGAPADAEGSGALRSSGDLVADTITRRILQSMRSPVVIAGAAVTISVTVGRAIYPRDAGDAAALLAAADESLMRAKHGLAGPA
jgi:PAS domain S-box-containing protein